MKPKIDPEFSALIPPLNEEELRHLHNSLSADGVRDALVVWKEENILVDGHNRWEYCKDKDILPPPRFEYESFPNREAVKQFMILNQLGRRNITPETASKLRAELAESITKRWGAPAGNTNAAKQKSDNRTFVSDAESTPTDTLSEVAKQTGVSRSTVAADVRLMKALDKLGISRNDYAAGKVLDADGKKRSKKSILDEAFPPKVKPAPAPAPASTPADDEDEHPLVVDEVKPAMPKRLPKYIPNDAHDIWAVAQTHLNRILPNDISREEVLLEVIEYCQKRISTNK